jgi:hypothetical protein
MARSKWGTADTQWLVVSERLRVASPPPGRADDGERAERQDGQPEVQRYRTGGSGRRQPPVVGTTLGPLVGAAVGGSVVGAVDAGAQSGAMMTLWVCDIGGRRDRRVGQTLLMAVNVAAAASFLTPVATPANLMVMGPGGYRFGDYRKLGLAMVALFFVVSVFLVPVFWSF